MWDRRALQDDPDGVTRTVHYLACYANRIAISNNRLLAIDGQDLWLRYKDYQDQNQWKTARMDGVEFVRRFLTHLLPRSMFHIRRYGFLGPRVQAQRIAQIRQLLAGADPDAEQPAAAGEEARDESPAEIEEPTKKCRSCGGKMFLSDRTPRPKVSEILRMPLHVFQQARTGIIITPGAKHTRDIASQKTETEKAETHPEQCSWAISAYW